MPEKVQEDPDQKQNLMQRGKLGIALRTSRLASVLIMKKENVLISTLILKRDPRGKEKEREVNLKILNAVVLNKDKVDKIAVELLQAVVRIRPARPLAKSGRVAEYVEG